MAGLFVIRHYRQHLLKYSLYLCAFCVCSETQGFLAIPINVRWVVHVIVCTEGCNGQGLATNGGMPWARTLIYSPLRVHLHPFAPQFLIKTYRIK